MKRAAGEGCEEKARAEVSVAGEALEGLRGFVGGHLGNLASVEREMEEADEWLCCDR